jgi:hypothetical protein
MCLYDLGEDDISLCHRGVFYVARTIQIYVLFLTYSARFCVECELLGIIVALCGHFVGHDEKHCIWIGSQNLREGAHASASYIDFLFWLPR